MHRLNPYEYNIFLNGAIFGTYAKKAYLFLLYLVALSKRYPLAKSVKMLDNIRYKIHRKFRQTCIERNVPMKRMEESIAQDSFAKEGNTPKNSSPINQLDPTTGLPEAFLRRMKQMLGEQFPAFLDNFSLGQRYHGLRVNPLKLSASDFSLRHGDLFHLTPVPWAPAGFYYEENDRPGKSVLHEAGLYYIQEPSAMSAAEAMDIREDEIGEGFKVLDLCAAPGGKTTQIAGKMGGKGLLVANEIIPSRAKILSQNIERLGIPNALVLNEAPARLAERYPCAFDRILVDAPCSGEGMYRKNDIAITQWSEENVAHCAQRQDEILDAAAKMLAPGGRLVYSTCTFAPAEDEGSVCRFLEAHPDFSLVDTGLSAYFSSGKADYVDAPVPGLEKTSRIWPHEVNGEGHFVAAFVKSQDSPDYSESFAGQPTGSQSALSKQQQEIFQGFCRETLSQKGNGILQEGVFVLFGDELYRLPAATLPVDRIKVVRSGIHVGSFRKNRFEPAHALALALPCLPGLSVEDFKAAAEISAEDAERYIRGETLCVSAPKGWMPVVLCEHGGRYPLGWGKSDGRMLKNHYPKGLRRM